MHKEVIKYDKYEHIWITFGRPPEQVVLMNGWQLAFRAYRDQLMVIDGLRDLDGGMIELNLWVPNEGSPQWTNL